MRDILKQLETLLRAYDFAIEANTVAGAKDLFDINPDKACQLMVSPTWWAGKDAVAEANVSIAGGFMPQARKDQQRLQQMFIDLYQQLVDKGYSSEHAKIVTAQYNKWQVSGML